MKPGTQSHTPGPWIARELHPNYVGFVVVRDTGSGLRRVDAGKDGVFSEVDAYLIAAAPELLAALISTLEIAARYAPIGKELGGPYNDAELNKARAAIAKAKGESV